MPLAGPVASCRNDMQAGIGRGSRQQGREACSAVRDPMTTGESASGRAEIPDQGEQVQRIGGGFDEAEMALEAFADERMAAK